MSAPHDDGAERALLAALFVAPDLLAPVGLSVDATDFHRPAHAHVFDAMCRLHAEGIRPDATTILDATRGVVDAQAVIDITAYPASSASAERYAHIVATMAARRRLIAAAHELAEDAERAEPDEALDAHIARLEAVRLPTTEAVGLMLIDEMLDRPDGKRAPWVVPGLLRRDWRVVVVAPEGIGKSLMLQQVALCASQGMHPFSFSRGHRPITVLLVDVENPDERIQEGCVPIRETVTRMVGGWDQRTYLWHRPGGLDLRSRRDVAAFEDVLYRVKPELVCAGPIYKLAERKHGEGWDEVARSLQATLDRLRTRFGFALLLEDHAPQAQGSTRELRPFGSSLWLRWPEMGLKLLPDERSGGVTIGHWRGARLAHAWPDELHRGGVNSLPWVGWWAEGMEF